jgi:putative flippase GtrA
MSKQKFAELRRVLVFGVVGTLNTVICYALYAGLIEFLGWNYDAALVADYAFGAAIGYALHRLATFGDRKHVKRAFGKYALSLVVMFSTNLMLLDALVGLQWFEPLLAQAVAMAAVTLLSYLMQTHWVFRSHAPVETDEGEPDVLPFGPLADESSAERAPKRRAA